MFIILREGIGVNEKDRIEIGRNILNNAANMNINKEILLKISQKIDKYIVEYFRKYDYEEQNQLNKKNT